MKPSLYLLRPFTIGDAEDFYRYSNDPVIHENMRDSFPKTPEACRDTVASFVVGNEGNQCVRAIEIDGHAVGCVSMFMDKDEQETGEPSSGHSPASVSGRGGSLPMRSSVPRPEGAGDLSPTSTGEIAYWLGEPYRGKGLMKTIIAEFCEAMFARYPIGEIVAHPYLFNEASRGMLESLGFRMRRVYTPADVGFPLKADFGEYVLTKPAPV